jgi:broad specificity phosphatase PhoE
VTGLTGVVRLTLISHAATDAMAAGRFPRDEPINAVGLRQAEGVTDLDILPGTGQFSGPERRARQTALSLGLTATTEPRLADIDCGRWCGETLDSIPPDELDDWLADPARAPHGGESVVDLLDRVAGWLASLTTPRTVAVTHPAVVRAAILVALGAPPKSFWRIDIAPVSRTVLHFRGGRWTVRL